MKVRVSLKKRVLIVAVLMLTVSITVLWQGKTYALNPQEEQVVSSISYVYTHYGEEQAYLSLQAWAPSSAVVQQLVNAGAFPNHVDDLKSLGYTDVDYSAVSGSSGGSNTSTSSTTEPTSAPEPTAFTVEDMEDTPMWAIQTVNYRDGASTDYNKLGSLEKYEQVIVNGVASTGWYRFNTADGTVAYVSDSYLTTEDPSNRELNIYNEETDQVDTFIFEDTDPEVIDEVIEDIKEEYAEKEPVVEEPDPEPEETVEPEPVVEEPPVEAVEETAAHSWQFYAAIIFAVVCVVVIGVSVFFIVRNKKRGRAD